MLFQHWSVQTFENKVVCRPSRVTHHTRSLQLLSLSSAWQLTQSQLDLKSSVYTYVQAMENNTLAVPCSELLLLDGFQLGHFFREGPFDFCFFYAWVSSKPIHWLWRHSDFLKMWFSILILRQLEGTQNWKSHLPRSQKKWKLPMASQSEEQLPKWQKRIRWVDRVLVFGVLEGWPSFCQDL